MHETHTESEKEWKKGSHTRDIRTHRCVEFFVHRGNMIGKREKEKKNATNKTGSRW